MNESQTMALLTTLVIDLALLIGIASSFIKALKEFFVHKNKEEGFEELSWAMMLFIGMLFISTPVVRFLLK